MVKLEKNSFFDWKIYEEEADIVLDICEKKTGAKLGTGCRIRWNEDIDSSTQLKSTINAIVHTFNRLFLSIDDVNEEIINELKEENRQLKEDYGTLKLQDEDRKKYQRELESRINIDENGYGESSIAGNTYNVNNPPKCNSCGNKER